jgi:hypothetical protein
MKKSGSILLLLLFIQAAAFAQSKPLLFFKQNNRVISATCLPGLSTSLDFTLRSPEAEEERFIQSLTREVYLYRDPLLVQPKTPLKYAGWESWDLELFKGYLLVKKPDEQYRFL